MLRAFIKSVFPAFVAIVALAVLLLAFPPDGRERTDWGQFIGRFHPLVVHLPIGLVLLVPILELLSRFPRWAFLRQAAGLVLGLAAVSAAVAVFFGWVLAYTGGYAGDLVVRHMWGGIALAALCWLALLLRPGSPKRAIPQSGPAYATALAAVLGLLFWTSHQGGSLARGEGYLTEFMPEPLRTVLGVRPPGSLMLEHEHPDAFYATHILPILENHCASCHSAKKVKGRLRLDSFARLMEGGESGPAVVASDLDSSELYRRITLPDDHDDFMPAEGKKPLNERQVKLLATWIQTGASPVDTLAQLVEQGADLHHEALASLQLTAGDYLREVKPILTRHCVRCHGADEQKAGLRVDTAEFMRLGGDSGSALSVRAPAESLFLRVLMDEHPEIPQMPYKKPPLAEAEIALLRSWVASGAPAPADEEPGEFLHWAFSPPLRPAPPEVRRAAWLRNPVDAFILARLEEEGIAPSPQTDPVTLLRRVTLDLVGLPPTPAEVDAFLRDREPGAYERVVDRLLASPHYGERWARPWLDAARYADSHGYSIDAPRQIWKYRDWVVEALNRDLPYDQFVIEQLAGDLLPDGTIEQKIATGFNRNTQINKEGGIDPEQFRVESVLDRVDTFGTAFLGMTIACAQCHDHKFDPVRQVDYYRLAAFFNSTVDDGHGDRPIGGVLEFPDELQVDEELVRQIERERAEVALYLELRRAAIDARAGSLAEEERIELSNAVRNALARPWERLTPAQRRAVYAALFGDDREFRTANARLTRLERSQPQMPATLVMAELPEPRETYLFIKGDFTRPGERVEPGTPAILPPLEAENPNRLDLARWVVDPANPLTARVMVNRIWQQYFGRGLVETENDFGTQGLPPSHPELLDWLAVEFMERQWSIKEMHRLIVTSATYRQASRARPDLEVTDPHNRLLARQARLRLDAEIVRDVALAAGGLLTARVGGPPVFPPQPEGAMNLGQVRREWQPSTGEDRYRRGLYTHRWRSTPHPALAVFDAPDGLSACTARMRSNTPLQALTLLNDSQFFEFAQALSRRVQREVPGSLEEQIDYAFRLCLARLPRLPERQRLIDLYHEISAGAGENAAVEEAWTAIARVLLNLDETITRE